MKCLSVITFAALLLFVAITLVEAQKPAQKKPKANPPVANRQLQANQKTGKVNAAPRAKTTTKKPTTKKKRKTTTTKKPAKKLARSTTKSSGSLSTVFDEEAPDNEAGSDCYDACFPNSSYFNGPGTIKNPQQYGKFVEFGGKTYLLGKIATNWRENWKTCCSIGMQPVIFAEQEEMSDFSRSHDNYSKDTSEVKYWTGGFKHELNSMWSWCTKDSPEPIDDNLMTDVTNKDPKDELNCVAMSASVGTSTTLTNLLCNITATKSSESINLACESIDKTPKELLGEKPKCTTRCSTERQCKRNDTLFKFNKNGERILEKRYTYGRWVSKCGRYFLFSNGTATYEEAQARCCALGTQLLSIKTAAKRKCLSKLTRDYMDITGEFWTSGTDQDCEDHYRWCSVDRAFLKHEVLWAPNEPNNKRGHCVTVKANTNARLTTLKTESCTVKKRYVCEVRQSGTTVEAVQKECVDLMGLSNDEVDGLNNTSNYTYTMKCYLKCIGDNLGMLVNGTLQEGNVMRLMEKSNQKTDMEKGYKAIDECKNKTDPLGDECQSAYNMYRCGKDQAPVVFGKMVVYKEVTCGETTDKNMLKSQGSTTAGGTAIVGLDGKKWYKSQHGNHTLTDAYIYCCALGMHLPLAKNYDDFKKLYDFMNGTNQDNYFDETYTDEKTEEERWCYNDVVLDLQMSENNFKLDAEKSFLYSHKGLTAPKYKLRSLKYSRMDSIKVFHFYCQPDDEISDV